MAEVKNAFIKSKMNKDLDARLIPNGEYRDAVNIQVSKSEGSDVGALENVLGNFEIADFEADSGYNNLKCIGHFVDEFNSIAYLFLTNYTDPYNTSTPTFSPASNNHVLYSYNIKTEQSTILVEGRFLNFSTNKPIIGVNLLENLLFWTDDRNQPRKINVDLARTQGYYDNEDKISVAKYYPYQAIEVIKETSTPGEYETTMYSVSEEYLPDGTTTNPYYDNAFPGDPQYLENKFVRFSYRFKFDDGEYSLIAPFTQPCFIPKQDGYFLDGDEKQTFASTIVEFMENKVDKINLQIPLPYAANTLESNLHIKEIDIIYKESDALALQVVETVPVSDISTSAGSNTVYEYSYVSQKPYKTLPGDEIARVYDKIPVKALGQEIISNRVVYANFQDKHTPPNFLNYKVNASEKYATNESSVAFPAKTRTEYPNHSLKENRNYQIGVVLADRYGRQSTTILSNNTDAEQNGFGADTIYLPYRNVNDSISFAGDSIKVLFNDFIQSQKSGVTGTPGLYSSTNPTGWYSYKIVVKQIEQEYYNVYNSGAVKGQPEDNTTQLEASFIVLLNDNINKVPRDLSEVGPQDKTFRSSVRLFGRVENTQQEFSNTGNAQYFPGRKTFTTNAIEDLFDLFDTSDAISNHPITNIANPYYTFLRGESNPFIGEFVTSQTPADQFGVINDPTGPGNTYLKTQNLAILETTPVVSRLDIYYETSTSGLISNLNQAIGEDTSGAFDTLEFIYNHSEADAPQTVVANEFKFVDVLDQVLSPISVTLTSVLDDLGNTRTSEFEVIAGTNVDSYDLRTSSGSYFYYGSDASTRQSYTFSFSVVTGDPLEPVTSTVTTTGSLTNAAPSIDNDNSATIEVDAGASLILDNVTGKNGSNTGNPSSSVYTQGLVFSIVSQTGAGTFALQQGADLDVINTDTEAEGTGSFTLRVTDAGGMTADKTFNVEFGIPEVDPQFTNISYTLLDGEGHAMWFTDNTTSLSSQIPSWLPSGYRVGYEAPTALNTTIANYVCVDQTPNSQFTNITTNDGLTGGYFYAIIEAKNTYGTSSGTNVECNFDIQYRATSSDPWTSAVDINDETVDTTMSGGWGYGDVFGSGQIAGLYIDGINDYPNGQDEGISIVHVEPSNTGTDRAGRVFAFKEKGEYRIIVGNVHSDYGFFQSSPNCSATNQNVNVGATLKIDDFFFTNDTNINPNSGVYRYALSSNNSCDATWGTASYYYAKEPFAKYVTQLYTDATLATKATLTSGTKKFRRMQSTSGSDISNPEHVKDGSYTATFNSTGLRTGSALACTYLGF